MFLVTGGRSGGTVMLDSTEIYDPDLGSWRAGAALPSLTERMQAASIGNRVLIFGIYIYCEHKVSLINTFDNN